MESNMMTLGQIEKSQVNLEVAREAFDQASKRLADMLDTKKAFEQKAFTLFSGYLTLSIALFGVAATLYKDHGLSSTVISFMLVELTLIAGAVCFVFTPMDERYGAIASDPNMWLNKGTIDGDDTVLPRMLAYITYYHQGRIDVSIESNNAKATHIRRGILLGGGYSDHLGCTTPAAGRALAKCPSSLGRGSRAAEVEVSAAPQPGLELVEVAVAWLNYITASSGRSRPYESSDLLPTA
jgi:hypothetical protein